MVERTPSSTGAEDRRFTIYHPLTRRSGGLQQRVEQQLEGAVRLGAVQDLWAIQVDAARPERYLRCNDAVLEILLAPRPAALQRRLVLETRDDADRRIRAADLEHRAVVEKEVRPLGHAGGGRVFRIDRRREHRSRDEVLRARQRLAVLYEVI